MSQLHKFLSTLPNAVRKAYGYEAHMQQRPPKMPRHKWARRWAEQHGLLTPQAARVKAKPSTRKAQYAASDAFLESYEWRRLRMQVLKTFGARCQCCGATPNDGVRMNVDHIKPRRIYPELALVESNLQVLCDVCNHGKGNWDETDWRPKPAASPLPADWYVPLWSTTTH